MGNPVRPSLAVCHIPPASNIVPLSPLENISTPFDKTIEFLKKFNFTKGTNLAIFGDHNNAYYHWHEAAADGDLRQGALLLHFDAHSDIGVVSMTPPSKDATLAEQKDFTAKLDIGQFITPAIIDGTVEEIYWVIPSWAPRDSAKGDSFWEKALSMRARHWLTAEQSETMAALYGPDRTTTFDIVRQEGVEINFYIVPTQFNKEPAKTEKQFTLHKIYLNELPNLSESGRDIILDIDLDWFGNTGFASIDRAQSSGLLEDERLRVSELTGRLLQQGIAPDVVTIATSPEYSFSENADDTLTALVESMIQSGIIAAAEPVLGEYSVSTNISTFANRLIMLTSYNMNADPRLFADDTSTKPPQWLIDQFLTGEVELYLPAAVDEARKFDSKTSVSRSPGKMAHYVYERQDYSDLIDECNRYGLTLLASALEALQALQTDQEAGSQSLKMAYDRVIRLATPLLNNGRLFMIGDSITIRADLKAINK